MAQLQMVHCTPLAVMVSRTCRIKSCIPNNAKVPFSLSGLNIMEEGELRSYRLELHSTFLEPPKNLDDKIPESVLRSENLNCELADFNTILTLCSLFVHFHSLVLI